MPPPSSRCRPGPRRAPFAPWLMVLALALAATGCGERRAGPGAEGRPDDDGAVVATDRERLGEDRGGGATAGATGHSAASDEEIADLRSLPYGRWVPVGEGESRQGVVLHDAARAGAGANLFSPRHLTRAFLIDMEGRTLHTWSLPRELAEGTDGFHHVEPVGDWSAGGEGVGAGHLLILVKNRFLAELDADSQVVWRQELAVHHDAAPLGPGGRDGWWVPTRRKRWVERDGEELPILEDRLTRIGPRGEVRRHLGLYGLFGERVAAERWEAIRRWRDETATQLAIADPARERQALTDRIHTDSPSDLFHLNSVERLERDVPGLGRAGDLLISIREMDTVAVVDPEAGEGGAVGWQWGPGVLDHQHQPSVTPEGHVLIFDNGRRRRRSRVVEVDPRAADGAGEIVWRWPEELHDGFFSFSRGGAQRLPGGNTLITESDAGHVVEVTPEGEPVWELYAPLRPAEGDRPARRGAIYRLRRLPGH